MSEFDAWELYYAVGAAFTQIDRLVDQLRSAEPTEDVIDVLDSLAANFAELEKEPADSLIAAERRRRVPPDAGAVVSDNPRTTVWMPRSRGGRHDRAWA